jgi:uncharacterized protein YndB with AHSA1/START domain
MIKWALMAFGGLAALGAVAAAVGYVLPKGHKASRTITVAAPPDAVFGAIADVRRYPEWRRDVKSVDVAPDDGKGLLFREHGGSGDVLFRFETMDAPRRLVARIADPSLPFGGTWTYELQPGGAGTALTITEDGEVYNPIFRVMQKLFFSPYKTIDMYQADLKRRLGRGIG